MKLPILAFALLPVFAIAAEPAASGVDTAAMNRSVDPCADFYQYACGNWISQNPLPSDRARWGRFNELQDRNEKVELDILQTAAVVRPGRSATDQQLGDFFTSCLDTATINKRGIAPIQSELDRIQAMTQASLVAEIAHLHRTGVGVFFGFGSAPDGKDSNRMIAAFRQGGIALPDRDYYLKTDPKSVEIRQRYEQHIKAMFQLAGDSAGQATAKSQLVLDLETTLAKAMLDRVSMRDPNKTYHIVTTGELRELTPRFDWPAYFKAIGAPPFETLNVGVPEVARQVGTIMTSQSLDTLKAYFAWHLLHGAAPDVLPEAFENETFDFWQRYLAGVKEPRPRINRCAGMADRALGDLIGRKYISQAFGKDAEAQITQMVQALETALGGDIGTLPWMTDATRQAALVKLKAITNNVGYPQKWRDYGKITIAPGDLYGNVDRIGIAIYDERIRKIGTPTDKREWAMTTPTVNAFYSPQNNSINFPAGILQPPFFDPQRDMAMNYGGVGSVIGHEMTHGFDDQGRKFDGDGNLRDWWTPQDGAEFEKRASCVANEYSSFTSVDDVRLNGRLTLGENTADNGGLRVAYQALEATLKGKKDQVDGYTPEQRLFLGFAQVWCESMSPQELRQRAVTDPHSPGRFRVNGTLQNMPEFQQAFSCKPGQPMVSENACRVW